MQTSRRMNRTIMIVIVMARLPLDRIIMMAPFYDRTSILRDLLFINIFLPLFGFGVSTHSTWSPRLEFEAHLLQCTFPAGRENQCRVELARPQGRLHHLRHLHPLGSAGDGRGGRGGGEGHAGVATLLKWYDFWIPMK